MIKLSEEQLIQLEDSRIGEFTAALVDFLSSNFEGQPNCPSTEELRTICHEVLSLTETLGISDPVAIAQLACLQVATSGELLYELAIQEYLADKGLAERERVQLLVDQLENISSGEAR